jgi:hypothetical protein
VSEEYKITAGTISGATLKSIDIEPSIIVDGKSYTASEFNKAVEMLKQPQLNENQQIVLDYLKGIAVKTDSAPIVTFADFGWQHFGSALPSIVEQAYQSMNGKQDLVVMSAYVNWALEQEEE